jgi:hypothetical protein
VKTWLVVVAFVAFLYAFGTLVDDSQPKPSSPVLTVTVYASCEHGESSVSPGSTVPATTGCVP